MRISDWSSDVCSSDLGPIEASSNDPREAFGIVCAEYSVELLARQARIRQDDLPLIIAIDVGNGVFHARSDKINFPSAPRKRTFDNVRFRLLANDSRAVTHDSGLARPKAHARTFVADLPNLDDRSEEHTSELQSLMRNSYAVFCLKKNK